MLLRDTLLFLGSLHIVTGFWTSLWRMGGRTSNCDNWSGWSPCINSHVSNVFAVLPAQCQANSYVAATAGKAAAGLAVMAQFVGRANLTAVPCGLCSYRVSCATSCRVPDRGAEKDRYYRDGQKFRGNRYGVTDELCGELGESAACVMDAEWALDRRTGLCQIWPPLPWFPRLFSTPPHGRFWRHQTEVDKALPEPRGFHQHTTNQLHPFNCVNVRDRCYCCCKPYHPDPCTGRCTYQPPSYQKILRLKDISRICKTERSDWYG